MGWHHIPAFETNFSEPDKSNNPWKGKNPRKQTRFSVAMPPDDWLCQKLERLNLTVAEGYPSCSQDSAGLKRDQFIKVVQDALTQTGRPPAPWSLCIQLEEF